MFDDRASRDAFRLAAESGRLAACAPQSVTSASPWCLEKSPNFSRNEPPNPAKYSSERPEMTTHDGKSRKATSKTKSTKGTKGEITQILQTHSGDHTGNRTRVARIRPASPSRLHRNPAASRAMSSRPEAEPLTGANQKFTLKILSAILPATQSVWRAQSIG